MSLKLKNYVRVSFRKTPLAFDNLLSSNSNIEIVQDFKLLIGSSYFIKPYLECPFELHLYPMHVDVSGLIPTFEGFN